MESMYTRTELLIGSDAVEKLKKSSVLVFGAGGVGSYCIEALARAGIGRLDIVDGDKVAISNINRQLIALTSTVGRYKADVAKERILDINPEADVTAYDLYLDSDTVSSFDFSAYSFVVDAIDTVTAKLLLAEICANLNVPEISCMGAGNKIDADFVVTDIYSTKSCPLARVMRRELKKRGIEKLMVVYSETESLKRDEEKTTVASISYVPGKAGLTCAGEVIKELIK
ncbi:MAG: tRNA threonylcarbamoyladenosine dehydratase [Clostridia bacterium]|nr:tRNA threonylcarbamoyladenosine dehydratase [Clostridia bacterium]